MVVVPYESKHHQALAAFSADAWSRPTRAAWLAWRYQQAPAQRGFLVMDGDQVQAAAFAFSKPWRIAGEHVQVLEPTDFATRPEHADAGLHLRALRALLDSSDGPVLRIGGGEDAEQMGFERVGELEAYVLPVGGQHIAEKLQERRVPFAVGRAAGEVAARFWFRPGGSTGPSGGEVVPVARLGDEVRALHEADREHRSTALPDPAWMRWATEPAAGGLWLPLHFTENGHLIGYTLGRVYRTAGRTEATLVDVHTPQPNASLYGWMIRAAVSAMLGFAPESVRAYAASPLLEAALQTMRFRHEKTHALRVYGGQLPGPVHAAGLVGDLAVKPYS